MTNPLGISDDERVWVGGHNAEAKRVVHEALQRPTVSSRGAVDVAVITPVDAEEAAYFAAKLAQRLSPQGRVWLAMPAPDAAQRAGDESADGAAPNTYVEAMCRLGFAPHDSRSIGGRIQVVAFARAALD